MVILFCLDKHKRPITFFMGFVSAHLFCLLELTRPAPSWPRMTGKGDIVSPNDPDQTPSNKNKSKRCDNAGPCYG